MTVTVVPVSIVVAGSICTTTVMFVTARSRYRRCAALVEEIRWDGTICRHDPKSVKPGSIRMRLAYERNHANHAERHTFIVCSRDAVNYEDVHSHNLSKLIVSTSNKHILLVSIVILS